MANFEDDDSNHSVNGWIKKEIEDEDFEDYIKHEQDYPSSERCEELMSLSKEDLVGRILQQEEDIRYLQDIRHGLEKNVEGFSSSCSQFKKLLEVMSAAVTNLKDCQQLISLPNSSNRAVGSASTLPTSRPTPSAPTSQASPRSTPTVIPSSVAPTASPRSTSSIPTTSSTSRSTASSVNIPSNLMSTSNVSNERTGTSVSSHQTVTITRQTNVIIKTEIPSPPPSEPTITSSHLMSPSVPSSNQTQPNMKNRNDPPSFYATRQQTSGNNASKQFVANSSRSITEIANSILPNRQRQRLNSSQSFCANASMPSKQNNQMNRPNINQQQFHVNQQPSLGHVVGGRGARGRGGFTQRSAPYTTQRPVRQAQGAAVAASMKPKAPIPSTNVSSTSAGDSSMNDILANICAKVPSGITLSIIPPKQGLESKTQSSSTERSANATKQLTVENNNRAGNTPSIEEITTSKPSSDRGVSSAGGTSTSFSASNTISPVGGNFQVDEVEEEEEGDYFEEIAVLIPDKKSSPGLDGSSQNMSDNMTGKSLVSADSKGQGQSKDSYWNSQNAAQKSNQTAYHNNAEYMFEETDDIDSDENDTKVYLGDNVTLPREMVDTCIKQGPTPTKLTRNLMKALFPDLRELASGCPEGDLTKLTQPMLPSNKVKAIIALVQKSFPQVNRAAILMTMNMKCKEAKVLLSKSGSQQYSY